ncbi:DUF5680 domain-containing protein [Paenibacillus gallinarum]|uniref:DUF5680 domain-containing protein n=1 Tax=Paenibacillus gallinarum TaxID=2762232 RepID=UPI001CD84C65
MIYSGGTIDNLTGNDIKETYEFLRKALGLVSTNDIYRGPSKYQDGILVYYNEVHGHLNNFSGQEMILKNGKEIYELKYSGGLIK